MRFVFFLGFAITISFHHYFVPVTSWLFIFITVFSSEDFFAFFSRSDRTTRPLTPYSSASTLFIEQNILDTKARTHKRQKYKWVISVVLELRQIISKTSCTQSRDLSEVQTFDIWSLCLTWTKRAIKGSREITVTKIVVNATYSSTLILSM